jgi:CheY-like chemotaxis protein
LTDNNHKTVSMADDAGDCWLANEVFAQNGARWCSPVLRMGSDSLNYHSEHSRSEAKRLPDLILLDLNMPQKDGREAVIEIKAEPALQHIPIVILTTSEEQKDIAFTMEAGAESFISRPGYLR